MVHKRNNSFGLCIYMAARKFAASLQQPKLHVTIVMVAITIVLVCKMMMDFSKANDLISTSIFFKKYVSHLSTYASSNHKSYILPVCNDFTSPLPWVHRSFYSYALPCIRHLRWFEDQQACREWKQHGRSRENQVGESTRPQGCHRWLHHISSNHSRLDWDCLDCSLLRE